MAQILGRKFKSTVEIRWRPQTVGINWEMKYENWLWFSRASKVYTPTNTLTRTHRQSDTQAHARGPVHTLERCQYDQLHTKAGVLFSEKWPIISQASLSILIDQSKPCWKILKNPLFMDLIIVKSNGKTVTIIQFNGKVYDSIWTNPETDERIFESGWR